MIALSNSRARACRSLGIALSDSLPQSHGQVCLANDTLIDQASYTEELTTYGIGYGSMTGNKLRTLRDFIAPPRLSNSRTVRLTQYDETEPWATVDYNKIKRAPMADFAEVRQRSATKVDRTIPNRGLTVRLDRDQIKDRPMWQQIHTQWLIDLLLRATVMESLDVLSAAALSDLVTWNSTSDPDMDIKSRLLAQANITGFYPRRALYGDQATLKRQRAYRAQLNAGSLAGAQAVGDDQIAAVIGLDAVLSSAERYQSGASARTELVGSNVLVFTSIDTDSPEDPSNLVRCVANASFGGGEYAVYLTQEGVKTIYLTVENYELISVQHTTGLMKIAVS